MSVPAQEKSQKVISGGASSDLAMGHVEWLVKNAPFRIFGSEDERRAASYFLQHLDKYGFETQRDEFMGYWSAPVRASLNITPQLGDVDALACAHSQSTGSDSLTGPIVDVSSGGLSDYEGVDVRGSIVLTELSYAPPRPEKARIAAAAGAVGIIFMNWGPDDSSALPNGAIKSIWGNPTPRTFEEIPDVPAVGVSRETGMAIRRLLAAGDPALARISVDVERRWKQLTLPWGRLRSPHPIDDKFVLVGGHYDAWQPGATDNATGNAGLLEVARILSETTDLLRRDVLVAFWTGHEIGEMEGSTWFVDRYWDELDDSCIAYINLDSLGMTGATRFVSTSSPELRMAAAEAERHVLGEQGEKRLLARTGDQSFFGIGIPGLYGRHQHPPETQIEWNNATLGWWYHSDHDTLDKIDPEILATDIDVQVAYVLALTGDMAIPLDPLALLDDVTKRVGMVAPALAHLGIPSLPRLEGLKQRLSELVSAARDSGDASVLAVVNDLSLRLSRILTSATRTVAGRWSQDSYGHSALAEPIPALAHLTNHLLGDLDDNLYWTSALAERNRIADAIRQAEREASAVATRIDGMHRNSDSTV